MNGRRFLVMFLTALSAVGVFNPPVAQADNTTCANADFLFLGERAAYSIGVGGSLYFKIRVSARRSYSVMAWAPFEDVSEGTAMLNANLFSDSACTTVAPGSTNADHEPYLTPDNHGGDVDSIIATTDGTVFIRLDNSNFSAAYTAHVLVVETTLFSPWWFTGGTNQAYVELRNNMSATTDGTVTLYASDGNVCGTSNFTIPGNGNAALLVNAIGTCAGAVSGSAQIAFQGTPSGMAANITTLDVPNGTSFDAPFTPRMVWSTMSR
jgi:hypothetical protein